MITIVDGLGQVGKALQTKTNDRVFKRSAFVYHTWNPWDKSRNIQKQEHLKFKAFVDEHKDERIIFVSTYSQDNNYYVHYKQISEAYLITNCKFGFVIRLPNLIGNKGIFKKLKEKQALPYGSMELMKVDQAVEQILDLVNYDGVVRVHTAKGESVSASIVNELIHKI